MPDVSIGFMPARDIDIYDVGSYIRFVCDAINFDEDPTIQWTKNGRALGQGRIFSLRRSLRQTDDGNYTCTAETSTRRIAVSRYLNIRCKDF